MYVCVYRVLTKALIGSYWEGFWLVATDAVGTQCNCRRLVIQTPIEPCARHLH